MSTRQSRPLADMFANPPPRSHSPDEGTVVDQPTMTRKAASTRKALKNFNYGNNSMASTPILVLESLNETFASKRLDLFEAVKVGRKMSPKSPPEANNGIFDSKVLSRNHAEIWYENGKVWVKDVRSSNGTFLNGKRLSEENQESGPVEVKSDDRLEFGIDINNEDGTPLYKKVSCKVTIIIPSNGINGPSAPAVPNEPAKIDALSRGSSTSTNTSNNTKIMEETVVDRAIQSANETNAELRQLQASLAEVEKQAVRSVSNQENRQSTISAAVASATADLNRQLDDIRGQTDIWKSKYESLLPELEKYKNAQGQADSWKHKYESLIPELEKYKAEAGEVAELKNERTRLADENGRLAERLKEGQKWQKELEGWKAKAASLEDQLKNLKEEGEAHKTSISETNSLKRTMDARIEELTANLAKAEKEGASAKSEATRLTSDAKNLKKELAAVTEQAQSLEKMLETSRTEAQTAQKEAERANKREAEVKKELESANAKIAAKEKEMREQKVMKDVETMKGSSTEDLTGGKKESGSAAGTPRKRGRKSSTKAPTPPAVTAADENVSSSADRAVKDASPASSLPQMFGLVLIGLLAAGGYVFWSQHGTDGVIRSFNKVKDMSWQ
ncbi:hypothetical protein HDV00_010445 [Rhizophlyctis rosea]|nr:hypothetical protein HDV00_010445 [Rhizophlyctis rosea]